jgi:DeoR/GlpR family transcriptional regulator of sugar metabolism
MLRAERQKKIKSILDEKQHAKITELSKWLNVSEMTIHRDLKPLIEDGTVIKTFGGVSLVEEEKAPETPHFNLCVYCHRQINDRFSYRLILDNSSVETACCVHCGLLRENQLGQKNVQGICYDFLTHVTISSKTAWYVIGADLNIGCCQPTVLPFGQWGHAEQFTTGFNGKIYNFQEALEYLVHTHPDSNCHCSSSTQN